MRNVLSVLTAPITDITGPLYHLIRGDIKTTPYHRLLGISPQNEQISNLFLALLRTATVAAFFFVMMKSRRFSWGQDSPGSSFIFATQWLIHPYAAALCNALMNGYPLLLKVTDVFSKQPFFLTKDDVGCFFTMFAFCFVAQGLKHYTNALDRGYSALSFMLGIKLGEPPEFQPIPSPPARSSAPSSTYAPQLGPAPQAQPVPPPVRSSATSATAAPQISQPPSALPVSPPARPSATLSTPTPQPGQPASPPSEPMDDID